MTLTYDLEIQLRGFVRWLRDMFMQNFTKLNAAVHELS